MGGKSNPPLARKHHFVPQGYLSAFAVPRKNVRRLEVFDFVAQKQYPSNTEDVAHIVDFNRVEIEGLRPDFVEVELAKEESKIAESLHAVIGSEELDPTHLANVLFLCSMLATRTPRFRANVEDFISRVYGIIAKTMTSSPERWEATQRQAQLDDPTLAVGKVPYEEMKAFAYREDLAVNVSTNYHVKQEFSVLPAILDCLHRRKWGLMIAERSTGGFITSDHPLLLTWTSASKATHLPPGFAMQNTLVTLTLSPRLCLVGAFEGVQTRVVADAMNVAWVNGAVAQSAKRQVYAHDMNFHYALGGERNHRKSTHLIQDIVRQRRARDD